MSKRSHSARAPTQRQLRVAEHIRRELAEILGSVPLGDPELDRISVTVSEVKISPDLRHATVYVMPLGGQRADEILQALRDRAPPIRSLLGKGLHLRAVPDLRFELDIIFDQADHMNRLLAAVVPPPAEPEDEDWDGDEDGKTDAADAPEDPARAGDA